MASNAKECDERNRLIKEVSLEYSVSLPTGITRLYIEPASSSLLAISQAKVFNIYIVARRVADDKQCDRIVATVWALRNAERNSLNLFVFVVLLTCRTA